MLLSLVRPKVYVAQHNISDNEGLGKDKKPQQVYFTFPLANASHYLSHTLQLHNWHPLPGFSWICLHNTVLNNYLFIFNIRDVFQQQVTWFNSGVKTKTPKLFPFGFKSTSSHQKKHLPILPYSLHFLLSYLQTPHAIPLQLSLLQDEDSLSALSFLVQNRFKNPIGLLGLFTYLSEMLEVAESNRMSQNVDTEHQTDRVPESSKIAQR